MKQVQKYIWLVEPSDIGIEEKPGYYFQDEVEQLVGPFTSEVEAKKELNMYAIWLQSPANS